MELKSVEIATDAITVHENKKNSDWTRIDVELPANCAYAGHHITVSPYFC